MKVRHPHGIRNSNIGPQRRAGDPGRRRDRDSGLRAVPDQPGDRLHPDRHARRPVGARRDVRGYALAATISPSPIPRRSSRSPSSASSCCCSRSGWSCRSAGCGGCGGWCSGSARRELLVSAALIGVAHPCSLGYGWAAALALGFALALSSTAVVLPLVGTTSPVGRSAFAMLLFEDLAIVPIVFALGALGAARRRRTGSAGLLTTLVGRRAGDRRDAAARPLPAAPAVRAGGADQEPGAVPRRSACWS